MPIMRFQPVPVPSGRALFPACWGVDARTGCGNLKCADVDPALINRSCSSDSACSGMDSVTGCSFAAHRDDKRKYRRVSVARFFSISRIRNRRTAEIKRSWWVFTTTFTVLGSVASSAESRGIALPLATRGHHAFLVTRIYIPRANHWFVALQVNVDIASTLCITSTSRSVPDS